MAGTGPAHSQQRIAKRSPGAVPTYGQSAGADTEPLRDCGRFDIGQVCCAQDLGVDRRHLIDGGMQAAAHIGWHWVAGFQGFHVYSHDQIALIAPSEGQIGDHPAQDGPEPCGQPLIVVKRSDVAGCTQQCLLQCLVGQVRRLQPAERETAERL